VPNEVLGMGLGFVVGVVLGLLGGVDGIKRFVLLNP
jgi:hypothetical protein